LLRQEEVQTDKFRIATDGMQRECYDRLVGLRKLGENGDIIADYLIAYKSETDTENSTRARNCLNIILFSEKVGKPLRLVTKEDIQRYFNSLRTSDPKHKWKGYWNLLRVAIPRFFKWLYYPDIPPKERNRLKLDMLPYIPEMRRKEKTYRPEDMWALEDSELFFKYCPDPRIISYHAIAHATGARPSEILGLTIGDIKWPADGTPPYFTVKGKTGQRTLRMYRFVEYVKEFIEGQMMQSVRTTEMLSSVY